MDRRAFLSAAVLAAAGARIALAAAWPGIKLSLSGRISEPIGEVANLKHHRVRSCLYPSSAVQYLNPA
jgi:hypothetical protein